MLPTWVVIGAGRCGLQLARSMAASGLEILGVEVRSPRSRRRTARALPGAPTFGPHRALPPATGVLVAVPDDGIAACAAALAPRVHANTKVALHASGLVGAAALGPLARGGRALAALHPLVSFPAPTGPLVPLSGALAVVEGTPAGVRAATWLARRLGMHPLRLATSAKPRYHAAAAIASNLTHALVAVAAREMALAGVPRRRAIEGLRRLVGGSVAAALEARGMERLTGPLARGDAGAVALHLASLPVAVADAYRTVGMLVVTALAAEQLLSPRQVRDLNAALTE